MAVWKTDEDIARDMDILSGIQSSEEKIKSYSSWGRGRIPNVHDDIYPFPEPQKKTVDEFKWFSEPETLGKLPDSIGRGQKLKILEETLYRNKEREVHEQLREFVGPGYSNAFIEESFKKRLGLKNEHKSLPGEQFQDSEDGQTNNDRVTGSQSESVEPNCANSVPIQEAEASKIVKSRRKKRRYRNAVLESLERMNHPENTNVENEQSETGFLSTKTSLFGTKSSNIPPACYLPGKPSSVTYSPQKIQKSFEYKESEFPNL